MALVRKGFARVDMQSGSSSARDASVGGCCEDHGVGPIERDGSGQALSVPGSDIDMLFDGAGIETTKCLARVFNGTRLDLPVFRQCGQGRKCGEYCGRHAVERQRPQGVWDPPGHISLPPSKLSEGQRAAQSRLLAAAAAESRACVAALQASSVGV